MAHVLLVCLALAVLAVLTRLAVVVHHDRPTRPPRSHLHELDPALLRLR